MLPQIKTILYATDVGPVGPHVFRYAMAMAERHDATIVAVSVLEPLGTFGQSLVDSYVSKTTLDKLRVEGLEKLKAELRERLQEFCATEFDEAAVCMSRVGEVLVRSGQPAEAIIKEAKRVNADVIVMGSHGHSAFGEMLLGSVAHKVTQRSPVPVLLVPVREDEG